MSLLKSTAIGVLCAALAVGAFAAHSPVGTWKGKIKLDLAKVPGSSNPQTHQALLKQQEKISKSTVMLTLSPNHRFEMKVTGAASASLNKTTKGTWSLQGDKLTLLADQKGMHPNPFTMAKDGKSFSVSLPNGIAALTFTR